MSDNIVFTEFKGDWEALYVQRYNRHIDELKWLYMELYSNESMLSELCYQMHNFFIERENELKNIDVTRENNPDWYRKNKMTGMALHIENYADTIKGVEHNIEHLQKCNIDYVHFMPFFETPKYNSDDGNAVSDFRKVKEELGNIDDFLNLTKLCHEKNINVSVDFVMNHTSNEHKWAKRAKQGDTEYINRYCIFENKDVVQQYEKNLMFNEKFKNRFLNDRYFTKKYLLEEYEPTEIQSEGYSPDKYHIPQKKYQSSEYNKEKLSFLKHKHLFQNDSQNSLAHFTWIEELNNYVMTTFHSFEWDLNYRNPRVFNEMMYNFMFIANLGVDIIQIDTIEYIWKDINTNCRNLPQVHTIARIMRMISEIVCPGVMLLGNIESDTKNLIEYFGEAGKSEFHMLYNKTITDEIWNSVATRNVNLLRKSLNIINEMPKEYIFVNYLRNHEDLRWNLDYEFLYLSEKIDKNMHKEYLNGYFKGITGFSKSRGEVGKSMDARGDICFCGTTASMCGLEKALYENNENETENAIKLEVMLYAYLFMQPGIPVIYSGDEIGQVNDYTYKENADKIKDIRNINRGKFDWSKAVRLVDEYSIEGKIIRGLNKIEVIKKREDVFSQIAHVRLADTKNDSIICIVREFAEERMLGIFNFSEHEKIACIEDEDGIYEDLITGRKMKVKYIDMEGYGFLYLKKQVII